VNRKRPTNHVESGLSAKGVSLLIGVASRQTSWLVVLRP